MWNCGCVLQHPPCSSPAFNHEDPSFPLTDLHISWTVRLPVYYQHGLTVHCSPDFLWWSYYPRFGQGKHLCLFNIPIIFHIYPILKTPVHLHRFPHTFLTLGLFFFFFHSQGETLFTSDTGFHFKASSVEQAFWILTWSHWSIFSFIATVNFYTLFK